MRTDHNLITSTFTTSEGVRVKVLHRPSGTVAESDVHDHRREARAQAMELLERALAEGAGEDDAA